MTALRQCCSERSDRSDPQLASGSVRRLGRLPTGVPWNPKERALKPPLASLRRRGRGAPRGAPVLRLRWCRTRRTIGGMSSPHVVPAPPGPGGGGRPDVGRWLPSEGPGVERRDGFRCAQAKRAFTRGAAAQRRGGAELKNEPPIVSLQQVSCEGCWTVMALR